MWRLPDGWRAEALQYPVPDRLIIAGLMNYVFERDYALLATLHVPASAEPGGTFPIDARLDYLVCTDQVCVPETATVSTELAIGEARDSSPFVRRLSAGIAPAVGRRRTVRDRRRAAPDRHPDARRDAGARALFLSRHS